MRQVLHILTRENDALAKTVIAAEKALSDQKSETVDLTKRSVDYKGLVEKIFGADSIQVW